jgi:chromosome segregation ATPase
MAKGFGFEWPRLTSAVAGEIRGFVTRDLKHHDHRPESVTEDPNLSEWIRDAFAILERWADEGESPADHNQLDAIRDAFDRSMPAFAGLVKTSLEGRAETERLQSALEQQRGAAESASTQKAAAEKDAASWRETSADLQRQLEAVAAEAGERDREHQGELAGLRHALDEQTAAQAAAICDVEAERDKLALAFRHEIETMAASHRGQIAAIAARHKEQTAATTQQHKKHLSHLEGKLRAERARRDRLLATKSWRITAPLRRLTRLVRRR